MKRWNVFLVVMAAGCQSPAPAAEPAPAPSVAAPLVGTVNAAPAPEERRPREPLGAGTLYPKDAQALDVAVKTLLDGVPRVVTAPVQALLVPQGSLEDCGRVAAHAFKQVDGSTHRVVVVSAAPRPFAGVSVDRATQLVLPGGDIPVAGSVTRYLASKPNFVDNPAAHTTAAAEVQLPFLRAAIGHSFEVVPLVVGQVTPEQAQAVARELAAVGGPGTLFVFVLDLSRDQPYAVAARADRECLDAVERMDALQAGHCGARSPALLAMALEVAAARALTPRALTYANSGDQGGNRERTAGYGAVAFEDRFELGPAEQAVLLGLARQALDSYLRDHRQLTQVPGELLARFPRLGTPRGSFVTLKSKGELRGCIGTLSAASPLGEDVLHNALYAAINDTRFSPVLDTELPLITISMSVLDAPRSLDLAGEPLVRWLDEKRPGLILQYRGRHSTFLPEVWEDVPRPLDFLGHLCRKQGSPAECWKDPETRFLSYGVQHFGEKGPGGK